MSLKDMIFWWLPVRNRPFIDRMTELSDALRQITENQRQLLSMQNHLMEMSTHVAEEQRCMEDEQRRIADEQKRLADEQCRRSEENRWQYQMLLDTNRRLEDQNARLERILTYYHRQDMQMFFENYRKETESTLDAKKRFFTSLPKAQGYERDLQILENILLQAFAKICEENDLPYWIAFGSLLGVVRHHGFIPWDDDIDTCMAREDIDRLQEVLKDNPDYCLTVKYDPWGFCKQIRFWFKDTDLPVFLDVFPYDWLPSLSPDAWEPIRMTRQELVREITDENNDLIREFRAAGCIDEDTPLGQKIKQIFDKYYAQLQKDRAICIKEEAAGCAYSFDSSGFTDHSSMLDKKLYFPLKKMTFEGREYSVPNQSEYLQQQQYGLDFYTLPCGEPHFVHADWKKNQKLLAEEVKRRS